MATDAPFTPPPAPTIAQGGGAYSDLPNGGTQSPYPGMDAAAVPGGAKHPGKNVTAVNIAALKAFNENIGKLVAPLEKAQADLAAVPPLRAGAFGAARGLEIRVTGGNKSTGASLVEATGRVLQGLLDAITGTQAGVTRIYTDYTTTEEVNHLTAADLAKSIGANGGPIAAYSPNPEPPAAPAAK